MKKLLFIVFVTGMLCATGQSIKFHVNPGFIVSQIHGDKLGGYKKPGYSIGAGFLIEKSNTFEIDWSTRINQKGAREPLVGYLVRATYLETDLVFNYIYKQKLILGVGGYYGYMMAENTYIGFGYGGFRRSDIAPLFKVGVRLSEQVDLSARMANSVFSIRKNCVNSTTACWFNNSILFELSIKI